MQNKRQEERFILAFNSYSDALFRHALFRTSNHQAALDLVQDAFMKTWNQIVRGDSIENFQPYLYHVLNNLIIDFYRKKKSVSLDALADEGFDPLGTSASEIIDQAEQNQVMKYLQELPPSDRDVLIMRYVDGLQVKQIAALLQESQNAISVRLHRALKKLESQFNHHEKR
jgi:RNA polymerase sigma factor (sigma-70 family)